MIDQRDGGGNHAFARAVLGLGAVRLLGVPLGFATAVLGARFLGPGNLGAASVALAVGLISGVIFNVGINIAVIYLLGRRAHERDAVAGTLLRLAAMVAVAAFAFGVGAWPIISTLANAAGRPELGLAAGLVAAAVIGYEFAGALLLGLGRSGAYTTTELVRGAGTLLATWLLLSLALADGGFVLGAALGYAVSAGASLALARRTLGSLPSGWDPRIARTALGIGIRGQVGNVLQYLNLRLDQLLVPALLDLPAAGVYAVSVRVSEVVAQVASASGSLIFPSVASHEDARATELTERTVRLAVLLVAAAALVLVLLAGPLLAVAFGDEFERGATTVRILLVAMIPLSVTRILAGDLKGRGRPGLVSWVMAAAVALTVLLDLLLIPRLQIEGAALASLIAYTASASLLAGAFSRITGAPFRSLLPVARDLRTIARSPGLLLGRRAEDSEP